MKGFVFGFFLTSCGIVLGQNLQLHYDLGEGRKYFTSTVEMFKPDSLGSTFFFIDLDYDAYKSGVSLSYFEIARDIKFWKAPVTLHFEFNGGEAGAFSFPNNWLAGGAYSFSIGKNYITTQLLYKYFVYGSDAPDFQWTNIWTSQLFFNNKVYFTGYMDLWSQDNNYGEKQLVFQAEPQLWHTLYTKGWWIGTEVEISKNFLHPFGWEFMPTIGIKYEF